MMSADPKSRASQRLVKLLSANRSDHVTTVELRANTPAIVSRVALGGERIVVTRNRKPVAAIIPIQEFESLKKPKSRGH
ncbi:MAG: type II toxin-antitoxin system Phd/YefM family antitoxin [Candidatus Eremiobacteraeota bacterium]|nr:type II toxin-antitoxin system Phd/YefM family antitoxin [Candidatus Eremiobacteraeota bacterium]